MQQDHEDNGIRTQGSWKCLEFILGNGEEQEGKRQAGPDLLFQKIPLLICGEEAESRAEADQERLTKGY